MGDRMPKNSSGIDKLKPASVSFKTSEKIKDILEQLAREGHRSLSMQVEKMIIQVLEEMGIDWRNDE